MDDPTAFGLYLGCYHEEFEKKLTGAVNGKARGMSYNMQAYLENTVKKYQTLAGPDFKLKYAATPFLTCDDSGGVFAPAATGPGLSVRGAKVASQTKNSVMVRVVGPSAPRPRQNPCLTRPTSSFRRRQSRRIGDSWTPQQ